MLPCSARAQFLGRGKTGRAAADDDDPIRAVRTEPCRLGPPFLAYENPAISLFHRPARDGLRRAGATLRLCADRSRRDAMDNGRFRHRGAVAEGPAIMSVARAHREVSTPRRTSTTASSPTWPFSKPPAGMSEIGIPSDRSGPLSLSCESVMSSLLFSKTTLFSRKKTRGKNKT